MFNLAFHNKGINLRVKTQKKISRKGFLKWIGSIMLIPFGLGWAVTVNRQQMKDESKMFIISPGIQQGVSFHGPVIVFRNDEELKFFSSKCPHLGCRISKIENDHLVCPCHGSTFSKEGLIIKGPANISLNELTFTVDSATGEYLVNIV